MEYRSHENDDWNQVEPNDKQIVGLKVEMLDDPTYTMPHSRLYYYTVAQYDEKSKTFTNLNAQEDKPYPLSAKAISLSQIAAWKPVF